MLDGADGDHLTNGEEFEGVDAGAGGPVRSTGNWLYREPEGGRSRASERADLGGDADRDSHLEANR